MTRNSLIWRARARGSPVAVKKALGIERGHAAKPGRRDRLTIDLIGDVARGEYAGDAGLRRVAIQPGADHQITVLHLQLALEQLGIGAVADGDKEDRKSTRLNSSH